MIKLFEVIEGSLQWSTCRVYKYGGYWLRYKDSRYRWGTEQVLRVGGPPIAADPFKSHPGYQRNRKSLFISIEPSKCFILLIIYSPAQTRWSVVRESQKSLSSLNVELKFSQYFEHVLLLLRVREAFLP